MTVEKVNWSLVVLGGIVWFVVYGLLGAAAGFLYLIGEGREAFEQAGLQVVSHMNDPVFFSLVLVLALLTGIVSIWFYAVLSTRYGPGPKTAASAGIAIWILAQLLPLIYWTQLLGLPIRLVVLNGAASLGIGVAATLAGASVYEE